MDVMPSDLGEELQSRHFGINRAQSPGSIPSKFFVIKMKMD